MNNNNISIKEVIKNLDRRHIARIVLSIIIVFIVISFLGNMLYKATQEELELRGEMDVVQSSDRFNSYLIVGKNALITAGNAVNKMLLEGASAQEILDYITAQTDNLSDTLAKSFTGLYGFIRNEYLDGAGWIPEDDYIPTERPWYKAAITHPQDIVFVDPYVDVQTGNVMMTIASVLDDGESVLALDIGMEGVQEITETIAKSSPGGIVMVLDNSNTAITHSIIDEVGTNYSENQDSLGGIIVQMSENNDDHFTVHYSNKSYMVFIGHIEGGWRSISVIDTFFFYRPLIWVIIFTLLLGILAIFLLLASFYGLSQREIRNRILGMQIKAVADIYDNLLEINLADDSLYELSNRRNPEVVGIKCPHAQDTLNKRIEQWADESVKPFFMEFLDFSKINQRLADKDTLTIEFLDKENTWYRGRLICAERNEDRTVNRLLWGTESIDDEKKQQEHLKQMAETDLMTGIRNRVSGEHCITELLNCGIGGMFVLLDIDRFKNFNDQYGHSIGDQVIISVANCLKNAFRANDIVMRLGGDEFAAFAVGVQTEEIGSKILARFFDYTNNIVLEKSVKEKITISAGVVLCRDEDLLSFTQVYTAADKYMYESKHVEGNHVTYG